MATWVDVAGGGGGGDEARGRGSGRETATAGSTSPRASLTRTIICLRSVWRISGSLVALILSTMSSRSFCTSVNSRQAGTSGSLPLNLRSRNRKLKNREFSLQDNRERKMLRLCGFRTSISTPGYIGTDEPRTIGKGQALIFWPPFDTQPGAESVV